MSARRRVTRVDLSGIPKWSDECGMGTSARRVGYQRGTLPTNKDGWGGQSPSPNVTAEGDSPRLRMSRLDDKMRFVQKRRGFCAVLVLTVAGIAISACDQSPTSPSEIVGRTWHLVAIDRSGLPSIPAPSDRSFTVEVREGGHLAVRADCNSCSGMFELSGSDLTVRPLACTRAFCGNDSLDTPFLQSLSEARTVSIQRGELEIRAGSVTLRFA